MQPNNTKWLVIFDRVEPVYNVQEFIPLTLSGRVILTSENETACSWGTKILVDSMNEEQALEVLKTGAGPLATTTVDQGREIHEGLLRCQAKRYAEIAAKDLIRRLDGHPKSIAQAAAAVRMKKLLLTDYQILLQDTPEPRLFGSAIDQSPSSRLILRISAMLSSEAIPASLFLGSLITDPKPVPPRFNKVITELRG